MKNIPERIAEAREALGISQSELARRLGVTPQAVQSWEAGKATPRPQRLAEIAIALGVDVARLVNSETLRPSEMAAALTHSASRLPGRDAFRPIEAEMDGPIDVWDDDTPMGDDAVALPFLKEVELAAGAGRTAVEVSTHRRLRFGKYSLKKENVQAESAYAVTVRGNSMEPVLPDGATVAVNCSDTRITDGKTYAIDHDGQLRVKLLYRLPGGGVRVRSYNRDEHADEDYTPEQQQAQHFRIIGRVFWAGMYF